MFEKFICKKKIVANKKCAKQSKKGRKIIEDNPPKLIKCNLDYKACYFKVIISHLPQNDNVMTYGINNYLVELGEGGTMLPMRHQREINKIIHKNILKNNKINILQHMNLKMISETYHS